MNLIIGENSFEIKNFNWNVIFQNEIPTENLIITLKTENLNVLDLISIFKENFNGNLSINNYNFLNFRISSIDMFGDEKEENISIKFTK